MTKTPRIPGIFAGPEGIARAARVLSDSRVLRDAQLLVDKVVQAGELAALSAGHVLTRQDEASDDIFFVLWGTVRVQVNGQVVAERGAGSILGEMAALEPSPKRSATIVAAEEIVYLRISSSEFERVSAGHPAVWKGVARELACRLRERGRFVPCARDKPMMFIGSSTERLPVVDELTIALDYDVITSPWNLGTFKPSHTILQDLIAKVGSSDFAVFVFAPDDMTKKRGRNHKTVRDNVLFEVGLFMGQLGYERVFLVYPDDVPPSMPSDLQGFNCLRYTLPAKGRPNVAAAVAQIRSAIKDLGCRSFRPAPD